MPTASAIQAAIWGNYSESLGLDRSARYISGAPLRPVVPLDTAVGGVFVLGAYPSARFETVGNVSDVPVADNLGPFENERWFDGKRVRVQPSARELDDYFLTPLGISRSECWVTDLVKVFLFKEGHRERYAKLGASSPSGYERERFEELALRSLPWIYKELSIAKPRLVITLGAEVANAVRGTSSKRGSSEHLVPKVQTVRWDDQEIATIHCAHPGILMRPSPANSWPTRHRDTFVPAIAGHLAGGV